MQEAANEKQQPYLNHADMPTEDERNYNPPQVRLFIAAVIVGRPAYALSQQ